MSPPRARLAFTGTNGSFDGTDTLAQLALRLGWRPGTQAEGAPDPVRIGLRETVPCSGLVPALDGATDVRPWRRSSRTLVVLGLAGVAAIVAVALAVASAGRGSHDTLRSMISGGAARYYTIVRPSGLSHHSAVPLVVYLHGSPSSHCLEETGTPFGPSKALARCIVAEARSLDGWDALAHQKGFVVAYPVGSVKSHCSEGGQLACSHDWNGDISDDTVFLQSLIAQVRTAENVDPKRIYLAGVSAGAIAALARYCGVGRHTTPGGVLYRDSRGKLASLISGVGSWSGGLSSVAPKNAPDPACGNSIPPLPVIEVHGMDDPVIPYAGNCTRTAGLHCYLSQERQLSFFSTKMGCTAVATRSALGLHRSRLQLRTAVNCRAGGAYQLVTVVGGGHALALNARIDVAAKIWSFWAEHAPPAGAR
jgi:polyhydroxybutyrate depolymerase